MKTTRFLALWALIFAFSGEATAAGPEGKPFGLGISLGEPAGVNGKLWLDNKSALQFAIGFGYWPYNGFALFADYQYHAAQIMGPPRDSFRLLFYMGLGAKLGFWDRHANDHEYRAVGLGVRVPFGLNFVFLRHPFDLFLEVAPVMAFIAPDPFWFDLDAAIGFRFYF
jgi:hypothetical protein